MRLSPAALFVLVATTVTVVSVELRTFVGFFGVELTIAQSVVVALAMGAGIILWAIFPDLRTRSERLNRNQ